MSAQAGDHGDPPIRGGAPIRGAGSGRGAPPPGGDHGNPDGLGRGRGGGGYHGDRGRGSDRGRGGGPRGGSFRRGGRKGGKPRKPFVDDGMPPMVGSIDKGPRKMTREERQNSSYVQNTVYTRPPPPPTSSNAQPLGLGAGTRGKWGRRRQDGGFNAQASSSRDMLDAAGPSQRTYAPLPPRPGGLPPGNYPPRLPSPPAEQPVPGSQALPFQCSPSSTPRAVAATAEPCATPQPSVNASNDEPAAPHAFREPVAQSPALVPDTHAVPAPKSIPEPAPGMGPPVGLAKKRMPPPGKRGSEQLAPAAAPPEPPKPRFNPRNYNARRNPPKLPTPPPAPAAATTSPPPPTPPPPPPAASSPESPLASIRRSQFAASPQPQRTPTPRRRTAVTPRHPLAAPAPIPQPPPPQPLPRSTPSWLVKSPSPSPAATSNAVVDEKPLVDEIDSDTDVKMERDTGPRLSSPPVVPADLPMSGVDAFFVQDTPRECWRPPLAAKVAARKAFQVVVRKRLRKQGKNANRYRWRDDGLAVDWVRRTPTDESDDDEIQVIEAPPAAPIPTFVLEDSPEPGPLPPPSSSSNGGTRRWFPHSPPVAKRQRVTEPPAWQASGSHRPPAEPTQSISSSPMVSAAALPEVWAGSSVPPEALVRSSVPPEPARASSTAPQETLLEIQARMQALEDEMGARMRELQEQMKAAMQEQHMG